MRLSELALDVRLTLVFWTCAAYNLTMGVGARRRPYAPHQGGVGTWISARAGRFSGARRVFRGATVLQRPPGQIQRIRARTMNTNARKRRVALYLRVSTDGQTTENQRLELLGVAERAGWEITSVYEDAGVSGAKGRADRPEFDRLCRDAARRRFDLVAAWSVDRLGRSLQDLVSFLADIHGYGIDLYLHQQGVDTTTPAGKAMFQMLGVFAEFERSMIRERVKAGISRARAKGKKLGRPGISAEKQAAILADLEKGGIGIRRLAKIHGVGNGTVAKLKAELDRSSAGA